VTPTTRRRGSSPAHRRRGGRRIQSDLGGRGRTTGSTQERARIAVRKAINAAVEWIEQIDAGMGRHLAITIHTGSTCVYQPVPDDSPIWTLDRPGSA